MKYVERTILDEPDPGAWPRTVLERSGLLEMVTDPNLDRWTAGLRRATGAAVAAISLLDGESVLVKSLCTTAGPVSFAAKIAVDQSLEAYLVSRSIAPLACRAAHAYLERSIAVEGRVAGLVSLVDDGSRDWTPSDLEMLDDAVAAISTEVRPRPRSPLPEHLVLMEDGARLAGIAIERHQALERLTYDARHDDLTGLPNRARIFEALADALARTRTGHHVAVLFVDLDSLKTLNDSLGHDRADDVIREVGKRLSGAMRGNDFVGRFGGDEFVVVAEGIADQEEAGALGFRLLDAVSEPLPDDDCGVVTASIGIALLSGTAVDPREALRRADSAMYTAKHSGRDRCAFFDGNDRAHGGRRLSIARGLRDAELWSQLRLVFQPVFDLANGDVVGVEALLRWTCPTLGDVRPGEFIRIAEETGTIVSIGAWVLRESCEVLARLHEQVDPHLGLGVNLSGHQIARPGFARSVRQTLAHARVPAELLTLEIGESALMHPDSVMVANLDELDALGTRIVLDDFGTGFFSLGRLKLHPLDAIKVDRSLICDLVADPESRAVFAAIPMMAHALGCTVTAEGVENDEELAILRELGCDRAQGFLLGYPLVEDELLRLLSSCTVRAAH